MSNLQTFSLLVPLLTPALDLVISHLALRVRVRAGFILAGVTAFLTEIHFLETHIPTILKTDNRSRECVNKKKIVTFATITWGRGVSCTILSQFKKNCASKKGKL